MQIKSITLHSLRLPLPKPYKVAFKTYETFDPIVVEVYDRDGKQGWGESHIPEGYSSYETPKSGWDFRPKDVRHRITAGQEPKISQDCRQIIQFPTFGRLGSSAIL